MSKPEIRFVSVYGVPGHLDLLRRLLIQRPKYMNISHRRVPTPQDHRRFVRSKPYRQWSFVRVDGRIAGAIYLSKLNEIGFFLFRAHRGKGLEAEILRTYLTRMRGRRLLANVSVNNPSYARLFRGLGFRPIQNTYCLER